MKWFQHSTDSHDDPDISDAEDLFRDVGYSVFFKTLEIYGREFNSINGEGWLHVSVTFFRRKLRKSVTKVEQVLNFYQTRGRIFYKIEGETISLKIPKFLDKADNWTRRNPKEESPKLCSNSVGTTAIEEKKKRKEKEIKDNSAKDDFYLTHKKRKLVGKRLKTFELFWTAFGYFKGKAAAADSWIDIPTLTDSLVKHICLSAEVAARERVKILDNGGTPKYAQGWLSGKRWEDEPYEKPKGKEMDW